MIDGTTKLTGLIGSNISQSKSYVMHNTAFIHYGVNARYIPMQTTTKFVPMVIDAIRALPFLGANVTMPFKKIVMEYVDKITDRALAIGAVNTITKQNNILIGDNTDGLGFVTAAIENGIQLCQRPIYIFGAGGSARAISYELAKQGCRQFYFKNRTAKHIDDIENMLIKNYKQITVEKFNCVTAKDAIIINTTPLGSYASAKNESIWPNTESFQEGHSVIDIVYEPKETILLQKARKEGSETLNGLPMLLHQAAESFSIWTKLPPPIDIMKKALLIGTR